MKKTNLISRIIVFVIALTLGFSTSCEDIESGSISFVPSSNNISDNAVNNGNGTSVDNRAPIANSQSVTTLKGESIFITLTANDPDGDQLTWHIDSQPLNGTLNGVGRTVTYVPFANYIGNDNFTFYVNDGYMDSNIAIMSITVTPLKETEKNWIEKTSMPVTVHSYGYAMLDEYIYIIGGHQTNDTTTVQRYNVATDSWEVDTNNGGTLAPLPEPRSFGLHCSVIEGKIHAIAGWENGAYKGDHFIYDPDTNNWITGESIPEYPIGQFCAVFENKIYVFGGWRGQYKDTVYEYSNGVWTKKAPMPTPRNHGTACMFNRKIYVIGGEGGQPALQQSLDVVEVYDPVSNTWATDLTSMPEANSYLGWSGTPARDGAIYIFAGNKVYVYNIYADKWDTLSEMPDSGYSCFNWWPNGKVLAISSASTLMGSPASNNIFYIKTNGDDSKDGLSWSNAKNSIQAGIDAYLGGDYVTGEIRVASGTYYENIVLASMLKLKGGYSIEGGLINISKNNTIIDGGNSDRTVKIDGANGVSIDGFTITGGSSTDNGGGIYCYGIPPLFTGILIEPIISNCVITDNKAANGGGIYLGMSIPLIINCIISNNSAANGGGIYYRAERSYPGIVNCVLYGNNASSVGGGIYGGDYSTIRNCTIVDNTAGTYGGGCYGSGVYRPNIKNSIIWNNLPNQVSGSPIINYSCIEDGFYGTNNLSDDPQFLYPEGHNYRLSSSEPNISPCIDAGTIESTPVSNIDADGNARVVNIIDMGAYEYQKNFYDFTILTFPFNDINNPTMDTSGNNNHGIVNGAELVKGEGLVKSNAFRFKWLDRSNIIVPYSESQRVDKQITIEAWIKPGAWDNIYAGYNRFVSKYPSYLIRSVNGHANFVINTQNNGFMGVLDTDLLTLDKWHYVVGTFDSQSLNLYVDGVLKGTTTLSEYDSIAESEGDIFIGECALLNEGFSGIMDNIAIYKLAKTEEDIKKEYDLYAGEED